MQCTWQSLTRFSSGGLRRSPTIFSPARPITLPSTHHKSSNLPKAVSFTARSLNSSVSPAAPNSPNSPYPRPASPLPSSPKPSRLALAATKAVHTSLKEHAVEDAFMIVNSIRYAALSDSQKQNTAWDTVKRSSAKIPPGVSPRLPTHALLHGLVRLRLVQQASQLATSMMKNGIRVRGRTLEQIMKGLAIAATNKNAVNEASDVRLREHMERLLATPKVINMRLHRPSDPNTAFAIELLQAARKSRSHRTGAMFNTLITLCVINGEIILASLIFGMVVKDWERRSHTLTQMTRSATPESSTDPSPLPVETRQQAYIFDLLTPDARPTTAMLKAIVTPIQEQFAMAHTDDVETPNFQQTLQALAVLAALLNSRQLPLTHISFFLKTLSDCPLVGNWVWVMGDDGPVYVPAYQYFHETLLQLTRSLPTQQLHNSAFSLNRPLGNRWFKFRTPHPTQNMLPALKGSSYDSLIYYALRHRFSPRLAKQILNHMTTKREPALHPTLATHNIMLRAATLYRQRDVVANALKPLLELCGVEGDLSIKGQRPTRRNLPPRMKHAAESIRLPLAPSLEQILGNHRLLATYLLTLISCGQPGLVVQIMRLLFPIFEPDVKRRRKSDHDKRQKWRESLVYASRIGPHVLNAFLHALVKHGAPREAHSLFKLILTSSRISRNPGMEKDVKPWHVSIVTYTTMLQAYKKEFDRCYQRTGVRILSYLMRKTATLYRMAKEDIQQNARAVGKPDTRFYNALLKILGEYLPFKHPSRARASRAFLEARRRYAQTGVVDDRGRWPLMEEVIADITSEGYSVPIGFHHLFITNGTGILSSQTSPELDRRPFAFPKSFIHDTPYTLPHCNRKQIRYYRRFSRKSFWRPFRLRTKK
ncbi:hypothetical protein AN958_12874 [Leucoagaricus sp. SymC.cos]|nr:hypothetical protein AN958_12874 [Leucoagaricus sp. SymC.cos]